VRVEGTFYQGVISFATYSVNYIYIVVEDDKDGVKDDFKGLSMYAETY